MCWCTPNKRTPCCGSDECHRAASVESMKRGGGTITASDCSLCTRSKPKATAYAPIPSGLVFFDAEGRANTHFRLKLEDSERVLSKDEVLRLQASIESALAAYYRSGRA